MTKFTLCHPLMLIMAMCSLQGMAKIQGGEKMVARPLSFVSTIQEPVAQESVGGLQPPPAPAARKPVPVEIPGLPSCPTTLICEIMVDGTCVNKVFKTEKCETNAVSHITFPCVQTSCSCSESSCLCIYPAELVSISTSSGFPGYLHFGKVRNEPITLVAPGNVTVKKIDENVVVNDSLMNISINGKERTLKLITVTFKVDANEYKANVAVEVTKQDEDVTPASGYSVEYMGNSAIIGKKQGGMVTDVYPVRLGM